MAATRGRDRFNPRARVGRDGTPHALHLIDDDVSIHAPAWGATGEHVGIASDLSGFNPRARVGRDLDTYRRHYFGNRFNPRARVGRDGLIITH